MSVGNSSVHDDMLFNILKECKTLPVFLDQIFGFLRRRSDFYHIAKDSNSPIGLPEGLAESLVKHAFFKWKPKNDVEANVLQDKEIPPAVADEVIISSEEAGDSICNHLEKVEIGKEASNQTTVGLTQANCGSTTTTESGFTNSETYNGAVYGNYCWSQTIVDVDITLKVPENVTCKDLKVTILRNTISVKIKDEILLEGELCQKCKHNDAMWSLDKTKLQIHLDKSREMWWDCLVTAEDRLDLSKIDCTRPFEDLPEEAQAKIEELGWNQERKRLGLPTSDELAQQELLRRAWNAEGSPFSGPFDPNQVTFH